MKIFANIKAVVTYNAIKSKTCWSYYLHKFEDGYRWVFRAVDDERAINIILNKDEKDAEWRRIDKSFTTYMTFPFSEEDLQLIEESTAWTT